MANFVNENAKVKLVGISLSTSANASQTDDANGINGKMNVTKESDPTRKARKYYIAKFQDTANPFADVKTRVISQQYDNEGNPFWKAGDPQIIKNFVGTEIAGDIVTKNVTPYDINGRMVDTFTCVVLKGEQIERVFEGQGRTVVTPTAEMAINPTNVELDSAEAPQA